MVLRTDAKFKAGFNQRSTIHMITSNVFRVIAVSLLMVALNARADLVIQNVQYKPEKGVLFVKGKLSNTSTRSVYVVDARTDRLIATVSTKGNQFRADLPFHESRVPCLVQIQTNRPVTNPWGTWQQTSSTNSTSGDFSIARVRHAPLRCSE
jgi:hypothetical protein